MENLVIDNDRMTSYVAKNIGKDYHLQNHDNNKTVQVFFKQLGFSDVYCSGEPYFSKIDGVGYLCNIQSSITLCQTLPRVIRLKLQYGTTYYDIDFTTNNIVIPYTSSQILVNQCNLLLNPDCLYLQNNQQYFSDLQSITAANVINGSGQFHYLAPLTMGNNHLLTVDYYQQYAVSNFSICDGNIYSLGPYKSQWYVTGNNPFKFKNGKRTSDGAYSQQVDYQNDYFCYFKRDSETTLLPIPIFIKGETTPNGKIYSTYSIDGSNRQVRINFTDGSYTLITVPENCYLTKHLRDPDKTRNYGITYNEESNFIAPQYFLAFSGKTNTGGTPYVMRLLGEPIHNTYTLRYNTYIPMTSHRQYNFDNDTGNSPTVPYSQFLTTKSIYYTKSCSARGDGTGDANGYFRINAGGCDGSDSSKTIQTYKLSGTAQVQSFVGDKITGPTKVTITANNDNQFYLSSLIYDSNYYGTINYNGKTSDPIQGKLTTNLVFTLNIYGGSNAIIPTKVNLLELQNKTVSVQATKDDPIINTSGGPGNTIYYTENPSGPEYGYDSIGVKVLRNLYNTKYFETYAIEDSGSVGQTDRGVGTYFVINCDDANVQTVNTTIFEELILGVKDGHIEH